MCYQWFRYENKFVKDQKHLLADGEYMQAIRMAAAGLLGG